MIYRIDLQHFLTHAIDHFTSDELAHFNYAIISAKIANGGRVTNIAKINDLYPTPEMVSTYADYNDKDILEKMFLPYLDPKKEEDKWIHNKFYVTFINPLCDHKDIVIICDQAENDYIDIICKVLKNRFSIEVIDLNELFRTGRVGSIYIDRDEIRNSAVDVRRAAAKQQMRALESSRDGRLKLIGEFNKKEMISKLKELGINASPSDTKSDLKDMLIDAWANELDDNE